MKKRLASGYTFDASAQTVVHADFSDIGLDGIQMIVNVTDNIVIYNFADPTKGGSLSTDTLTLIYDTTSMADADELMVLVEDGAATVAINDGGGVITVDGNLSTVSTVTTVATVGLVGDALVQGADAHDAAVTSNPVLTGFEAKNQDGAALPSDVNAEGDVVRAAASLHGVQYVMPVNEDGSAIATVNAVQSGTWDEVGINDSGNSITVDYATTGSGTATGALRVELPTNGTGVIATVGAVTAITNALPAGTNAIGKLAANSGVDIGDVDITSLVPGTADVNLGKAEDAQHTSGDTGVLMLGVRKDNPSTAYTTTDNDYGHVTMYKTGAIRTAIPEEDFAALGSNHVKKYYTNSGAVTDGIVWSPAAGKRWYVTDLIINVSAAATVTFEDDKAGGDEAVMKFELAANSGITHSFSTPWFSGEDAADLLVTTSAGNVYITITGYEI